MPARAPSTVATRTKWSSAVRASIASGATNLRNSALPSSVSSGPMNSSNDERTSADDGA